VVTGAVTEGLGAGELVALPRTTSFPVAGGLLDGARVVANGTPLAVPRTDGGVFPPSSAPMAHTNSSAPIAVPAAAVIRRRRYTDGDTVPLASSTCGN
jgi:hypothetical protein